MRNMFICIVALVALVSCNEKKANPTTQVVDAPVITAPAPTPVVTKDATPVLEAEMSLDPTPVM